MSDSYRTVRQSAADEFVEKKSRFIGHACPVTSEAQARAFIDQMRTTYWDASHHVYAYVVRSGGVTRFSDDGEPSGTAGMPVLEVMRRQQVQDVVVVVTRYFGGILLGAGGLIRAYAKGAKAGLDAAGIIPWRCMPGWRCAVIITAMARWKTCCARKARSLRTAHLPPMSG